MRPLVLIALLGVCLAACSSNDSADHTTASTSVTLAEAESPVAVAPSIDLPQSDPVAAAIAFVASTDELMGHSPIGRREIFRKLVAPATVAEQVAAFEQAAADLALTLDVPVERLVWVEAPLTATLVDSSNGSAAVDVWTVSVLGAPGGGSPQQVWRTVHVGLGVLDGEWMVTVASADAGPTPAANELSLQSGWDDFERVAAWPTVVEGVGL